MLTYEEQFSRFAAELFLLKRCIIARYDRDGAMGRCTHLVQDVTARSILLGTTKNQGA